MLSRYHFRCGCCLSVHCLVIRFLLIGNFDKFLLFHELYCWVQHGTDRTGILGNFVSGKIRTKEISDFFGEQVLFLLVQFLVFHFLLIIYIYLI